VLSTPAPLMVLRPFEQVRTAPVDIQIDYLGFETPDAWVVGYSQEYANVFRTLLYIAALRREVYESR